MNNRIKELAWSVGISGKNGQGEIHTDWDEIEKFAELIVKECANQIIEQGTEEMDWGTGLGIRPDHWNMAQHIKEHLGVK